MKTRLPLLQLATIETLKSGLFENEPIIYRENGHRAKSATAFLKKIRPLAKLAGVTRVADITNLSAAQFPVFQSARPDIIGHTRLGQNTGAQGKGLTRAQSELSCLMESIESFCAEPRQQVLVRGSFDFLKQANFVADPRGIVLNAATVAPKQNEPFMWTPALDVRTQREVLIPAEAVLFPFAPADYDTRAVFYSSSNGLASGSSYLEAVIHGLYEVIERDLFYQQMTSAVRLTRVVLDEVPAPLLRRLRAVKKGQIDIALFTIIGASGRPPYYFAVAHDQGVVGLGLSCGPTPELTAARAVSESLQSLCTLYSSSREDLRTTSRESRVQDETRHQEQSAMAAIKNAKEVVNFSELCRRPKLPVFKNLLTEYRFLTNWLFSHGYGRVYISNLTRSGIDIPVVKVVVPKLRCHQANYAFAADQKYLAQLMQYSLV